MTVSGRPCGQDTKGAQEFATIVRMSYVTSVTLSFMLSKYANSLSKYV